MYKAIVRARVRRGIQRLNEGDAEFVLGLAVPDVELAFPGDNSYQIDEILVNGPPWNTRVAMRAVDWVVGPDGADAYNNRMVSFLELRGARSSAGRSTRTRSE